MGHLPPSGVQLRINAGYAIGGTTPLPLPAEIRSIDRFRPYGGLNVGFEASKMFGKKRRWGLAAGLHGFLHGMKTGAHVKGYKMAIVRDGEKWQAISPEWTRPTSGWWA